MDLSYKSDPTYEYLKRAANRYEKEGKLGLAAKYREEAKKYAQMNYDGGNTPVMNPEDVPEYNPEAHKDEYIRDERDAGSQNMEGKARAAYYERKKQLADANKGTVQNYTDAKAGLESARKAITDTQDNIHATKVARKFAAEQDKDKTTFERTFSGCDPFVASLFHKGIRENVSKPATGPQTKEKSEKLFNIQKSWNEDPRVRKLAEGETRTDVWKWKSGDGDMVKKAGRYFALKDFNPSGFKNIREGTQKAINEALGSSEAIKSLAEIGQRIANGDINDERERMFAGAFQQGIEEGNLLASKAKRDSGAVDLKEANAAQKAYDKELGKLDSDFNKDDRHSEVKNIDNGVKLIKVSGGAGGNQAYIAKLEDRNGKKVWNVYSAQKNPEAEYGYDVDTFADPVKTVPDENADMYITTWAEGNLKKPGRRFEGQKNKMRVAQDEAFRERYVGKSIDDLIEEQVGKSDLYANLPDAQKEIARNTYAARLKKQVLDHGLVIDADTRTVYERPEDVPEGHKIEGSITGQDNELHRAMGIEGVSDKIKNSDKSIKETRIDKDGNVKDVAIKRLKADSKTRKTGKGGLVAEYNNNSKKGKKVTTEGIGNKSMYSAEAKEAREKRAKRAEENTGKKVGNMFAKDTLDMFARFR